MEELRQLMQSLTASEWNALQVFLTAFSPHNPGKMKQLKLARLLREAKQPPEKKYCIHKIYESKKSAGFQMLKSRLKEKVLDFLLTDISDDKRKELDDADYSIVKLNKKSAQFRQLFYSKKRIHVFYGLLDEIIFLSKEYEQYSILVDSLRVKKTILGSKKGKEEFENINKEMEYASLCSRIYNKTEHYYSELMLYGDYSGKPDKQKINSFLKKVIPEISEANAEIKSPMINYYLKMLELGFYELNEDYLKARSICLELLNIVRNNKSVYRRQRVGVVYDNLSRCEYYLGNYEQAIASAQEAQKHFNAGSENYCIALEQEFYALFAMGNYTDAGSIAVANRMLTSASRKELGEFRWAKYNYLLACALFRQNNYYGTLKLLNKRLKISNDKAGWELGVRLLRIMALIELNHEEQACAETERLRKFTGYLKEKNVRVSMRDKVISKILFHAAQKEFDLSKLSSAAQKDIVSLYGKNEKFKWKPFTHEVIPFHEWFAQKCGKKIAKPPLQKKKKVLVRK